jgi:hypothetical protein
MMMVAVLSGTVENDSTVSARDWSAGAARGRSACLGFADVAGSIDRMMLLSIVAAVALGSNDQAWLDRYSID